MATAPRYPGLAGTRHAALRLAGPAQTIDQPARRRAAVHVGAARARRAAGRGLDMPGQSAAFTSAPLAAPLQLTGSATVRIRVSGAADITVFAKVYDVDQAGQRHAAVPLAAPLRVTGAAARRARSP